MPRKLCGVCNFKYYTTETGDCQQNAMLKLSPAAVRISTRIKINTASGDLAGGGILTFPFSFLIYY